MSENRKYGKELVKGKRVFVSTLTEVVKFESIVEEADFYFDSTTF